MTAAELNTFRFVLGISESGGDYNNDRGQYWGKYQFGEARRYDIEHILGMSHLTRSEFTPEMQELFFNVHVNDLETRIIQTGLGSEIGKTIKGKSNKIKTEINIYGLIAGAHLGGFVGLQNYFSSKGTYDPKDSLGTHISDYIAKFSEKKTLIS